MELDADARELVRMMGEEAAFRLMRWASVWGAMMNSGPRLDYELARMHARPLAAVRADLRKVATAANVLADLLYPEDTLLQLVVVALTDHRISYGHRHPREAVHTKIQRFAHEARALAELAERTADGLKVQRGPKPKDLQRMFVLTQLAALLAREGIALSTGENSKLVRIARIICARLEIKGDPRDTLRWLVESGHTNLKAMTADAKWMREQGSQPASVDQGGAIPAKRRKRTP